ncbi:MAG: class I SAM-dependent methyltransferase [Atribacterota bacterium]|nr:class I SAM-dependent methyltransferase [Atribacterota bacterium]
MEIFDKEATKYDSWYETKIGKHADKVETDCALKLFKLTPGMDILDVGCGTGNFSIKIAEKGAAVTGIDISEKMLNIAEKKANRKNLNIEFIKMNSLQLGFQDNYFDGVVSMATIEFISNPEKMINEMFRVCKKDGLILLGTINRESDWGRLYQDPKFLEVTPIFREAKLKSPKDLSDVRKDELIEIRECLFLPPDISEYEISQQKEEELSCIKRGGFFCMLWKKK